MIGLPCLAAPLVDLFRAEAEAVLGGERRPPRHRHVLAGEDREHAIADQLQHVAAGLMDRVDRGLGIIVEKGNDLVRADAFRNLGRAAQIGEPQHRIDALGDAAGDAPAQHLLGGVAAEIDAPERARDIDLLRRFDRKRQRRHQIAQRFQFAVGEAALAAGREIRVEAIHLAERAGVAEAMDEAKEMPVPLVDEVGHHRKFQRGVVGQIELKLVVAVFEHVMEGGAPPVLGGIALG